jgi:HK97 family phage portal protein
MKWPWTRKKTSEVKGSIPVTIPIPQGSFMEYLLYGGGYVTPSKAMEFYRETSSIATCVDLIAEAFEQIQPVLQMEDGIYVSEHSVLDLLNRPNGFDTWSKFAGEISRHWLLTHDSHVSAIGTVARPPLELWATKPQNVQTQQAADLYPLSYSVPQGMSKGHFTRNDRRKAFGMRFYDGTLKEMYHIMGFSSRTTQLSGDSPLQAAALEAKQLIEGRTHNLQLLRNGGRLSLAIAFKDEDPVQDDEHKERVKAANEQLAGSGNAGKIAVFSNADMTITEMGKSNKDMDYAKLDVIASEAVYRRYNIPLPLISVKASTFNNMQTAIELFYDQAVLPTAKTLFTGLSMFLLPRYQLDPTKVQITFNPESIKALRARVIKEVAERRKINIETTNELRSLMPNREPIEGGNVLYQPATLVPVGTDLFTEDNPDTPEEDIELDEDE